MVIVLSSKIGWRHPSLLTSQSSWCLLGSWMNFQCNCFAFSVSNFCRHSGHWNVPVILIPTFSIVPLPDFAASETCMLSSIVTGAAVVMGLAVGMTGAAVVLGAVVVTAFAVLIGAVVVAGLAMDDNGLAVVTDAAVVTEAVRVTGAVVVAAAERLIGDAAVTVAARVAGGAVLTGA